jgi:hypothetical protein
MTTPITVSIPHQLGRAEARRRIQDGFGNISRQFPGSSALCSQRWDGDRLSFSVGALGQSISGTIDVLDDSVAMRIELPGVLGLIANRLKARLRNAAQLLLTKE